jgi:hypothetical protein
LIFYYKYSCYANYPAGYPAKTVSGASLQVIMPVLGGTSWWTGLRCRVIKGLTLISYLLGTGSGVFTWVQKSRVAVICTFKDEELVAAHWLFPSSLW